MILFNIAVVIFACLASTVAGEQPSRVALNKAFLLNKAEAFRKLGDAYGEQEYYTMQYIVKFYSLEHTTRPLAYLKTDEQKVSNTIRLNSFMYPILATASFISDSLKANALHEIVFYQELNMTSEYSLSEITDKVLQVIHQENDILVNGRLVKRDEKLQNLYAEMIEIAGDYNYEGFWFRTMHTAFFLRDRCTKQSSPCSEGKIREAIDNYLVVNKQMKSVSPIDSKFKIDNLLQILPKFFTVRKQLRKILDDNELRCIISVDGCKK